MATLQTVLHIDDRSRNRLPSDVERETRRFFVKHGVETLLETKGFAHGVIDINPVRIHRQAPRGIKVITTGFDGRSIRFTGNFNGPETSYEYRAVPKAPLDASEIFELITKEPEKPNERPKVTLLKGPDISGPNATDSPKPINSQSFWDANRVAEVMGLIETDKDFMGNTPLRVTRDAIELVYNEYGALEPDDERTPGLVQEAINILVEAGRIQPFPLVGRVTHYKPVSADEAVPVQKPVNAAVEASVTTIEAIEDVTEERVAQNDASDSPELAQLTFRTIFDKPANIADLMAVISTRAHNNLVESQVVIAEIRKFCEIRGADLTQATDSSIGAVIRDKLVAKGHLKPKNGQGYRYGYYLAYTAPKQNGPPNRKQAGHSPFGNLMHDEERMTALIAALEREADKNGDLSFELTRETFLKYIRTIGVKVNELSEPQIGGGISWLVRKSLLENLGKPYEHKGYHIVGYRNVFQQLNELLETRKERKNLLELLRVQAQDNIITRRPVIRVIRSWCVQQKLDIKKLDESEIDVLIGRLIGLGMLVAIKGHQSQYGLGSPDGATAEDAATLQAKAESSRSVRGLVDNDMIKAYLARLAAHATVGIGHIPKAHAEAQISICLTEHGHSPVNAQQVGKILGVLIGRGDIVSLGYEGHARIVHRGYTVISAVSTRKVDPAELSATTKKPEIYKSSREVEQATNRLTTEPQWQVEIGKALCDAVAGLEVGFLPTERCQKIITDAGQPLTWPPGVTDQVIRRFIDAGYLDRIGTVEATKGYNVTLKLRRLVKESLQGQSTSDEEKEINAQAAKVAAIVDQVDADLGSQIDLINLQIAKNDEALQRLANERADLETKRDQLVDEKEKLDEKNLTINSIKKKLASSDSADAIAKAIAEGRLDDVQRLLGIKS